MSIKLKYDLGTEVYFIVINKYESIECPYCNGLGDMKLTGKNGESDSFICPCCDGEGSYTQGVDNPKFIVAGKGIIKSALLTRNSLEGPYKIKYCVGYEISSFEDDYIFDTQEEAEAACERLNQEIINGEL